MNDGVQQVRMLLASDPVAISTTAGLLQAGGLVAIPTETVYGLAADATNGAAVARIFGVKQRPSFDPLIVHVYERHDVDAIGVLEDPRLQALATAFWPGPLTLILPDRGVVHPLVTSGLGTVAVRVPAHPVARALLAAAGCPLAAPSANPFGGISPSTAAHVRAGLGDALDATRDAILDGGPCAVGLESTVVAIVDGQVQVLRDGGLSREAITAVIGPVFDGVRVTERPLSPGQLARHYAPRTPLRIVGADALQPAMDRALLVVAGPAPAHAAAWAHVCTLAPDGDLTVAAAGLFDAMHTLDTLATAQGWVGIDVVPCAPVGLGRAILDRLQRAAVG